MSKLPTYDAPLGGLPQAGGRRATAEDFGAEIGTAGIRIGASASAAVKQITTDIEDSEARSAITESMKVRASVARSIDEAAVSGADLEKLRENVENEINKIGEGFTTKRGRDALAMQAASIHETFQNQANAVAVRRARSSANLSAQTFLNNATQILQLDPNALVSQEQSANDFVSTLTHASAERRQEIAAMLKEELNVVAAMRSAYLLPEETKAAVEAGKWTLTTVQRSAVIGRADETLRAQRVDENYKRALEKERKSELNDEARDSLFKAIRAGSPGMEATVLNDHRLEPATREHLINVMDARTKEIETHTAKSDPVTKKRLFLGIFMPEGEPGKIYNGEPVLAAVAAGRLSTEDGEKFLSDIADQKDPNNRAIGSRLSGLTEMVGRALSQNLRLISLSSIRPTLLPEIQMDYAARVQARIRALRNAKESPEQVFDPSSKHYVGTKDFLQASIDTVLQGKMPKVVDLRETPDDWKTLKEGDAFITPSGQQAYATKAMLDALSSRGQPAPKPKMPEPPVSPATAAYQAAQERAAIERGDVVESVITGGKGLPTVPNPERKALREAFVRISQERLAAIARLQELKSAKPIDQAALKEARRVEEELGKKARAAEKAWEAAPERQKASE